jgi:hypothetical protein
MSNDHYHVDHAGYVPTDPPRHPSQPGPQMRPAPAATEQRVYVPHAPPPPPQHAPPPPPPPNPVAEPVREGSVTLSRPYRAHGIDVSEITLRRPVGRDIARHGNPFRVHTDDQMRIQHVETDYAKIIGYLPLLSTPQLPASTVAEMAFEDLEAVASELIRFFVRLG